MSDILRSSASLKNNHNNKNNGTHSTHSTHTNINNNNGSNSISSISPHLNSTALQSSHNSTEKSLSGSSHLAHLFRQFDPIGLTQVNEKSTHSGSKSPLASLFGSTDSLPGFSHHAHHHRLIRKVPLKKSNKNKRSSSMYDSVTSVPSSTTSTGTSPRHITTLDNVNMESTNQSAHNLNNSNGTSSPPPPPLPPPSARLGSSQSFINDLTKPLKRIVVVQRDARGYGIRISGDNPVSIESVTPDGAAHRAGVRNGDQILKINGSLATKMSHADVVQMIRNCGSFVSLQLLTLPRSAQLQQQQQQQQQQSTSPSGSNSQIQASPSTSLNCSVMSGNGSPPTTSPTPVQQSSGGGSCSLTHSNSFQSNHGGTGGGQGASTGGSGAVSGSHLSRQITLPLPVAENTQKEYMKNQIDTFQRFIQTETDHLGTLKDQEKIEKCKDKIQNFKRKLHELQTSDLKVGSTPSSTPSTTTSTQITSFDTPPSTSIVPKGVGAKTLALRTQFGERFDSDDEDSQQILPIGNEILFSGGGGCEADSSMFNHSHHSASFAPKSPPTRSTYLTPKSKRDSKSFDHSSLPITLENLSEHSLRVAKHLINQNHVIPHAMLFLVTTKRIFPEIVACATRKIINNHLIASDNQINGLKQLIQRWASQIMATWVVKESPLFFHEFSPEQMSQYDVQLSNFILTVASRAANSGPAANPFDVFLEETCEIVTGQLHEFQQAVQVKPEMMLTKPKEDLQSTIEQLLLSVGGGMGPTSPGLKLDIRDVDSTFDQLIYNAHDKDVTTMAVISGLLTVGHFEFGCTSKHLLLSDVSACISQIPTVSGLSSIVASTFNPVMKLSDPSSAKKGNHKRNVSLPASTKPNILSSANNASFDAANFANAHANSALPVGGIPEQDHYFVLVNDLTSVEYCRGKCQLTLWGDQYNYQCYKCKLYAHYWCLKPAAGEHLCVTNSTVDTSVQMRANNTGNIGDNRKKRRSKTDAHKKTSVIEMLTNKVMRPAQELHRSESSSSTSTTISLSSSSEASDFEADYHPIPGVDDDAQNLIIARIGKNPSFSGGSSLSVTSPTIASHSAQHLGMLSNATTVATAASHVPRSGSFNQRKRGKASTSSSTPRKRSDPALTSRNMSTIHMAEASTPPLSSAHSSGALLSGVSGSSGGGGGVGGGVTGVGAGGCTPSGVGCHTTTPGFHHSASFCSDGVGAAIDCAHGFQRSNPTQSSAHFPLLNRKTMTASDSSLLSSTTTQSVASVVANLTRQTSATSQRASKRSERKKTADSAIHMDPNMNSSDSDGESEGTLKHRSEEDPNIDPVVCDEQFGPPPPLPPPSNPRIDPPPLPPRPHVSEKRRQIKEEIVDSENSHYCTLKYIREIFYLPLKKGKFIPSDELKKIFLNIRAMQSVHRRIAEQLQRAFNLDNELGSESYQFEQKLKDIFSGSLGSKLEYEASYFCGNQKIGNGMEIWNKKRNNGQLRGLFDHDLRSKEMPDNQNARLSLPDLMGKVFQRPLRYTLLIDRLLGATPKETDAYKHLQNALQATKMLGDAINETTKKYELKARLEEIIRKTDSKDHPILMELEKQQLIHDGPLTWKVSKSKSIDVLLVVTNKMMIVFNRDSSGDRYYLKKMTNPVNKRAFKLDIRFDDLLVREQAINPCGIIVVSNLQEIFYDFEAPTSSDAKMWIKTINKTVEQFRQDLISLGAKSQAPMLRDLPNTGHGRSKSSLADMDHFSTTSTVTSATSGVSGSSGTSSTNIQPSSGTLPPNFVNRPLPEVPSDPTATIKSPVLSPTSATTPGGVASTPNKFAGSIGNFIEKNELVDFDEVRITPKPQIFKAEVVNEHSAAISTTPVPNMDFRFRSLAEQMQNMKAELEDVLVICDMSGYSLENDVKEKFMQDLLHMAIRVDNNNRPTREPFGELVNKTRAHIRSLNERNSPELGQSSPTLCNNHSVGVNSGGGEELHQANANSQHNQRKSQDSLQLIDDLVDLQISEFESKAKSSNNSESGEDFLELKPVHSSNPFENGVDSTSLPVSHATSSQNQVNPFYFGSDPNDFEILPSPITNGSTTEERTGNGNSVTNDTNTASGQECNDCGEQQSERDATIESQPDMELSKNISSVNGVENGDSTTVWPTTSSASASVDTTGQLPSVTTSAPLPAVVVKPKGEIFSL